MTAIKSIPIVRGAEVLPNAEALEELLGSNRRFRVKIGIDPTTPRLHWGHALCLLQGAAFQDAGHEVMLVVGTFTATVGDPSGCNSERPVLSFDDARGHAEQIVGEALRILRVRDTQVVYNHEWLSDYTLASLFSDLSAFTAPQVLARQSFRDRLGGAHPLTVSEMLYPFLQGLDSIHLRSDIEIGGREQVPNFTLTRRMQKARGQSPEICCTLPLVPGTDGAEKMSASEANAIHLDVPADVMFGQVMSVPDSALPGFRPLAEMLSKDPSNDTWPGTLHPMEAKTKLARRMIRRIHDESVARSAEEGFNLLFRRREIPEDIPEIRLSCEEGRMALPLALVSAGMASSRSEARRLVRQGAIRVDGEKAVDPGLFLPPREPKVLSRSRRQHVRVVVLDECGRRKGE